MQNKQKYVVRCIKKVTGSSVGLAAKTFKVGQYLTTCGNPTSDINNAHVYSDDEENSFSFTDTEWDDGLTLSDYFEPEFISIYPQRYFVAMIRPTSSGGEIDASTMRIFSDREQAEKYNTELEQPVRQSTGFLSYPATMFCELYPDAKPIGLNNTAKVRIG